VGKKALDILRRERSVDLVITDQVMPQIGVAKIV
jgi:YesN/AraC family two-component response regulator